MIQRMLDKIRSYFENLIYGDNEGDINIDKRLTNYTQQDSTQEEIPSDNEPSEELNQTVSVMPEIQDETSDLLKEHTNDISLDKLLTTKNIAIAAGISFYWLGTKTPGYMDQKLEAFSERLRGYIQQGLAQESTYSESNENSGSKALKMYQSGKNDTGSH